jgi:hypothetical protein
VQGCPISWKSKSQKTVTLSSSEAELMALSEATQEIWFIYEILISMGVKVKLPIICRVDNVGAIFIAENACAIPKSKHIDTRAKYVAKFIADGFLKIDFVKSRDNKADIFTKNVSQEDMRSYESSYIWTKDEMEETLCKEVEQEKKS